MMIAWALLISNNMLFAIINIPMMGFDVSFDFQLRPVTTIITILFPITAFASLLIFIDVGLRYAGLNPGLGFICTLVSLINWLVIVTVATSIT